MGEKIKKCKKCGGEAEKIGQEPSTGSMLGSAITSLSNPAAGMALFGATLANPLDVYRCKNEKCGYEWKE